MLRGRRPTSTSTTRRAAGNAESNVPRKPRRCAPADRAFQQRRAGTWAQAGTLPAAQGTPREAWRRNRRPRGQLTVRGRGRRRPDWPATTRPALVLADEKGEARDGSSAASGRPPASEPNRESRGTTDGRPLLGWRPVEGGGPEGGRLLARHGAEGSQGARRGASRSWASAGQARAGSRKLVAPGGATSIVEKTADSPIPDRRGRRGAGRRGPDVVRGRLARRRGGAHRRAARRVGPERRWARGHDPATREGGAGPGGGTSSAGSGQHDGSGGPRKLGGSRRSCAWPPGPYFRGGWTAKLIPRLQPGGLDAGLAGGGRNFTGAATTAALRQTRPDWQGAESTALEPHLEAFADEGETTPRSRRPRGNRGTGGQNAGLLLRAGAKGTLRGNKDGAWDPR